MLGFSGHDVKVAGLAVVMMLIIQFLLPGKQMQLTAMIHL